MSTCEEHNPVLHTYQDFDSCLVPLADGSTTSGLPSCLRLAGGTQMPVVQDCQHREPTRRVLEATTEQEEEHKASIVHLVDGLLESMGQ